MITGRRVRSETLAFSRVDVRIQDYPPMGLQAKRNFKTDKATKSYTAVRTLPTACLRAPSITRSRSGSQLPLLETRIKTSSPRKTYQLSAVQVEVGAGAKVSCGRPLLPPLLPRRVESAT